jgi:glycosyltransferase involved in cell wall biosynthesis
LYDYIDGFVVRQFEAVVAVSDTIATQVRSLGVERSRISTISNGTSFTDIQNGSPMLRGLEPGEIVIGTVCRLTTQKGLTYLLEAATPLLEQYPYIRFLIVGEGRDRNSLETVAKDTDISHRVTFAGLRRDIANVYASMDIFVLPSIDEGMPMALLEAMATGKAIVATNVGDVPKLIKSGETGLLIRPKEVSDLVNAISSLVKSENLRSKLGAQARAFVCETFSSERMAGQYLDLYRQLHEKGKAKSRASKTEPIGNYGA